MAIVAVHEPVLSLEVLRWLEAKRKGLFIDGTLGNAGHALQLLQFTDPESQLVGIDQDAQILEIAKERLKPFQNRVLLIEGNFSEIEGMLKENGVEKADGIYLDLGVSSLQLEISERGFSFLREGPLDMRMNLNQPVPLLQKLKKTHVVELARIIEEYGEERLAFKMAKRIMEKLRGGLLKTTKDLAQIAVEIYPPAARYGKRHPATLLFQALRIWVNDELGNLKKFLRVAPKLLNARGRLLVISYHSLEDRIVKQTFRALAKENKGFEVLTKKPVLPSEEEIYRNPRARSAKLRVLMRSYV